MNNLVSLSRRLWLEAELSASPAMRHTIVPRLHQAKEIMRLLTRPRLTIRHWSGQNEQGPLTVGYVGFGNAAPFLKSILFSEKPADQIRGSLSVWSPAAQLARLDCDLVIIEASQFMLQRLTTEGMRLPLRLQQVVHIEKDWEAQTAKFHKTAHKNDVRLIRKHDYHYQLSRDLVDIDRFYHIMYVPTTKGRHDELASVASLERVRQYANHGFLISIIRDDQVVAGGICSRQGNWVNLAMTGVINADDTLMREGAISAIYYFLIQWAQEAGLETVSLGYFWPFLEDGIFKYKRKWGTTVLIPARENKQLWFRVQRDTPAVRHYLAHNPCVTVDANSRLHGLIVSDRPQDISASSEAQWEKQYLIPGIADLRIRSVRDLLAQAG